MSMMPRLMSATEKYLFDLRGFLVIRNVFTKQEVAAANAAIDAMDGNMAERKGDVLRNTDAQTSAWMAGDGSTGRLDLGGMLGWPSPHRDVFRRVLAHPRLVPYLTELLGEGYRMDHLPLVIASNQGADGFNLHGGTIDPKGQYVPHLAYTYSHGKMHNALLACSVQLSRHGPGDGGFVVVPGSHKSNFPTPGSLEHGLNEGDPDLAACVQQPVTEPGDVVLFSEGTVHGAAAWKGEHQRRVCLYRFAPSTHAYGRSYFAEGSPSWPSDVMDGLTPEQAAVLQPPYANRIDRP